MIVEITCYTVRCGAQVSDDCDEMLLCQEFDTEIHFTEPGAAEEHAADSSWAKIDDVWHCTACKKTAAGRPHGFQPDEPGSSVCLVCEEWATEGTHGLDVAAGQLELPVVGQEPR